MGCRRRATRRRGDSAEGKDDATETAGAHKERNHRQSSRRRQDSDTQRAADKQTRASNIEATAWRHGKQGAKDDDSRGRQGNHHGEAGREGPPATERQRGRKVARRPPATPPATPAATGQRQCRQGRQSRGGGAADLWRRQGYIGQPAETGQPAAGRGNAGRRQISIGIQPPYMAYLLQPATPRHHPLYIDSRGFPEYYMENTCFTLDTPPSRVL